MNIGALECRKDIDRKYTTGALLNLITEKNEVLT